MINTVPTTDVSGTRRVYDGHGSLPGMEDFMDLPVAVFENDLLPPVVVPSGNRYRDKAVPIVNGFSKYNNSIYLMGAETPFLVRAQQKDGTAFFETLDIGKLRNELESTVRVVTVSHTKEGDKLNTVKLKPDILNAILSLDLQSLPFDTIEGVVEHSIFNKAGDIVDKYGYDKSTRRYINSDIPFESMNIDKARDTLLDILADFPLAEDGSRENALSLFFTFICSELYSGPTPCFIVNAYKEGTGKTLLVQSILAGIFGKKPSVHIMSDKNSNDEELKKCFTTDIKNGKEYIILDNFPDGSQIKAAILEGISTSGVYTDRLLGSNTSITLPFRQPIICTGNNLMFSPGFARKIVPINLTVKEDSKEYRHECLLDFCIENRALILNATLTLVQAWIESGCTSYTGKPLDSFEQWTKTIGGIVEYTLPDSNSFLANQKKLYEESIDNTFINYSKFLEAVYIDGKYIYTVKELVPLAEATGVLDEGKDKSGRLLGKLLNKINGRVFDGYRLERQTRSAAGVQYKVLKVEESTPSAPEPEYTDTIPF